MSVSKPHFLLLSECRRNRPNSHGEDHGQWRFVLEAVDGSSKLEVIDQEPDILGERLELLAVVRGLEALDQPSRITLVTPSRYVSRGLRHGLNEWRDNNWQWERYGSRTNVKNGDLWKRIDRAMRYHELECRTWRFDTAHTDAASSRPLGSDKVDACPPAEANPSPNAQRSTGWTHATVNWFARAAKTLRKNRLAKRSPSTNRGVRRPTEAFTKCRRDPKITH